MVTETYVKHTVENCLDRLANLIESDIVKTVEATFDEALQSSYLTPVLA